MSKEKEKEIKDLTQSIIKNGIKNQKISDKLVKNYTNEKVKESLLESIDEALENSNSEDMDVRIWVVTGQIAEGFGFRDILRKSHQELDRLK